MLAMFCNWGYMGFTCLSLSFPSILWFYYFYHKKAIFETANAPETLSGKTEKSCRMDLFRMSRT